MMVSTLHNMYANYKYKSKYGKFFHFVIEWQTPLGTSVLTENTNFNVQTLTQTALKIKGN